MNFSEEQLELLIDLEVIKTREEKRVKKLINILFFYLESNSKLGYSDDKKRVLELGGLFVIGTERHESRRIDNQLRGRAGRQGDPGSSRFYISLEDRIFRLFGGNNIKKLVKTFRLVNDAIPLESRLLTKSLELAQEKVENYYYEIRKNIYDYDEVLNEQRKLFYLTRSFVLNTLTIRNWALDFGEWVILDIINYLKNKDINKQSLEEDLVNLKKLLGFSFDLDYQTIQKVPSFLLFYSLREELWLTYDIKESNYEALSPGTYCQFEKISLLQAIDFCWSEHLQKMSDLRESVVWRAYAQRDPLIEYKQEAYTLFTLTLQDIRNYLTLNILSTDLI